MLAGIILISDAATEWYFLKKTVPKVLKDKWG